MLQLMTGTVRPLRSSTHGLAWFVVILAVLCCGADVRAQYEAREWDFDHQSVHGFEEGAVRKDVVPGELLIDPPTLENLGFRWYVKGDSNRNATVEVDYRAVGQSEWRRALPMLRIHHEIVQRYALAGKNEHYRTGNLFAGSVLSLEAGTAYEVRFVMADPDGGAPAEPKVLTVSTRSEPAAWEGGRILHVYPRGYDGEREADHAFDSLAPACEQARPGDVLLLHAGVHQADDAPYTLTQSGEPGKPIVIRGVGVDQAIIEGPDLETDLFRIAGTQHLLFEDLTMRRFHTAIHTAPDRPAGRQPYDPLGPGASWLTVRRCQIEDVINGIATFSKHSRNWHIADNVITGTNEVWYPRRTESRNYMDGSHTGVMVYGQGHVVCYNRISRFSDSLTVATFNHPAADELEAQAVNIDFYGNDLSYATDDTIEADYGCHNIRVYRNLLYNSHTALSVQPSYGGPIYLIRNEAYGITSLGFKWNNNPTGILAYHNTIATDGFPIATSIWSNSHLYNNLLLGSGRLINAGTFTPDQTTMDYNGYRASVYDDLAIRWVHGEQEQTAYPSLNAFAEATGYEKHGMLVGFDAFMDASPVKQGKTYGPNDFDLRLKPGSSPVDAGRRLPNVNDEHRGEGPDLGAIEAGSPRPHYGPRPF